MFRYHCKLQCLSYTMNEKICHSMFSFLHSCLLAHLICMSFGLNRTPSRRPYRQNRSFTTTVGLRRTNPAVFLRRGSCLLFTPSGFLPCQPFLSVNTTSRRYCRILKSFLHLVYASLHIRATVIVMMLRIRTCREHQLPRFTNRRSPTPAKLYWRNGF